MRREVLVVAAVALVATFGVMVALLGGSDDGGAGPTAIVAPANTGETTPAYAPQHTKLQGAFREGVVSAITPAEIRLVDEKRGSELLTFVIPPELGARIDFTHMRADASSGVPFRIYYRKAGDTLVMLGFTHPRRGGG